MVQLIHCLSSMNKALGLIPILEKLTWWYTDTCLLSQNTRDGGEKIRWWRSFFPIKTPAWTTWDPVFKKGKRKKIKTKVYYQKIGLKKNPMRMLFIKSWGLARVEFRDISRSPVIKSKRTEWTQEFESQRDWSRWNYRQSWTLSAWIMPLLFSTWARPTLAFRGWHTSIFTSTFCSIHGLLSYIS